GSAAPRLEAGRKTRTVGRAARARRASGRGIRRAAAAAALRRTAAARGRRPCPRCRPARPLDGRAVRRARSDRAALDAEGVPGLEAEASQGRVAGDARSARSVPAGRPRGDPGPREGAADRHAAGDPRRAGGRLRARVRVRRASGSSALSGLAAYFWERRTEIAALTGEHVVLVVVSTALAVGIGVPLGVALTRRPHLARPVLGFANVMQTVPSLALFGFLIPIPFIGGIGARTAIIALALYALLPVIRNTVTGILGIDPKVSEAAVAMGMTGGQRLRLVELPLAMPVMLTGIRVAVVISVGVATVAAAVGA